MRLDLGRRADYAIRAALDLARHANGNGRRKARAIADEMDIPASYVPQILAELVRSGLVSSVAGRGGGYRLAWPPEDVSLLAVIRALEGEADDTPCVLRGGPCRWEDVCAVHVPWSRAQDALLSRLDGTSLRELVEIDAAMDEGAFRLPPDVAPPREPPPSTPR